MSASIELFYRGKLPPAASGQPPKTPAPKNGWFLSELARLTELPATTVRYYLQLRVIEPIEIRGTAIRFDRHNFLRSLS
jgi:hypothetical protein